MHRFPLFPGVHRPWNYYRTHFTYVLFILLLTRTKLGGNYNRTSISFDAHHLQDSGECNTYIIEISEDDVVEHRQFELLTSDYDFLLIL